MEVVKIHEIPVVCGWFIKVCQLLDRLDGVDSRLMFRTTKDPVP